MPTGSQIVNAAIAALSDDLPRFAAIDEEHQFIAASAKALFFGDDFTFLRFKDSFTDGANDGGIDMLFVDPRDANDDQQVIALQGKFSDNFAGTRDFKNELSEALMTLRRLSRGEPGHYNERLRAAWARVVDSLEGGDFKIVYMFITPTNLEGDTKEGLITTLKELVEQEAALAEDSPYSVEIEIVCGSALEASIERAAHPTPYVSEGKLERFDQDGLVEYDISDKIRGCFVNVSSKSIADAYLKFHEKGLFAQNNRFFIRSAKVDGGIKKSIETSPDKFWFLNNGLVIVCENYFIDGEAIKLYNFSIVNGCQTTVNIGKSKLARDFRVPLKIVSVSEGFSESPLVGEIAEASNSQKPIKDRDLKSNAWEQKRFQSVFLNFREPMFFRIKRGEGVSQRLDKWKVIDNDNYGQYVLALQWQMPGTARNRRGAIFGETSVYDKIFGRRVNPDPNLAYDLLQLRRDINHLKNAPPDTLTQDQVEILLNGEFHVIAFIGFCVKIIRGLRVRADLFEHNVNNSAISDFPILGSFLLPAYEDKDLIFLIRRALKVIQDSRRGDGRSAANFLKSDGDYIYKSLREFYLSVLADEEDRVAFFDRAKKVLA